LVIFPEPTSTKVALFHNYEKCFNEEIPTGGVEEKLSPTKEFDASVDRRLAAVEKSLEQKGCDLRSISCIMGQGGLVDTLPKSGVYSINEVMLQHLREGRNGLHASNLGAHLAYQLGRKIGCAAYIADPIVVDEQTMNAKLTGIKGVLREARWHTLNQKHVARCWAEENKKNYAEINVIVAHIGGGVTVGAHYHGQVVDVNNGFDGEGVFSLKQAGYLTPIQTMKLAEKRGKDEVYQLLTQKGGFYSLFNIQDFKEVLQRVDRNDSEAITYYRAFVYQLAKQICSVIPAFYPEEVDQLIFTGSLARSLRFVQDVVEYLPKSLSEKYSVYAGEYDMEALAYSGIRLLRGLEKVRQY
jgi:butyrate kinase